MAGKSVVNGVSGIVVVVDIDIDIDLRCGGDVTNGSFSGTENPTGSDL